MVDKIAAIKKLWDKARENKGTGNFDELEDGRYLTVVTDAEVNESKGSGRLQIFIEFKVQEGEFEKKKKRMYVGLDSEMGVQIAVNTLNRLGVDIEDPSDLEEGIKAVIGKVVKIQLKASKNGEFQNVSIIKVVGEEPSEKLSTAGPVDDPEPETEAETPAVAAPAPEKKAKPAPAPEPTPEPSEEPAEISDEVEMKVGMKVAFNLKKKEVEGTITKIEEEQGTAVVEVDGKKYRVPGDQLLLK